MVSRASALRTTPVSSAQRTGIICSFDSSSILIRRQPIIYHHTTKARSKSHSKSRFAGGLPYYLGQTFDPSTNYFNSNATRPRAPPPRTRAARSTQA